MKKIAATVVLITVGALWSGCQSPPPDATAKPTPEAKAKAAKEALTASQLPRVMILVDEKSLGTLPTSEVTAMASRKLIKLGVPVVDQDMVRANTGKGQQQLKMAGDNKGAAALGMQYGADIVIVGEVVAKPSARRIGDSNLRAYQAASTLCAVRTDNSATIAGSSEESSVIGIDDVVGSAQAIKAAGEKSLDVLIKDLLAAWKKNGRAGSGLVSRVTLTVGGVDQLWQVKALRESLAAKKEKVANLSQRNYSSGVVIFDIDALVSIEELSESIVLEPPEGLKFQVLEIGSGAINLKAVEK